MIKKILFLFFLTITFSGVYADINQTDSEIVPGVYLVKSRRDLNSLYSISSVSSIRLTKIDNVYSVEIDPTIDPDTAKDMLQANPDVELVEPMKIFKLGEFRPKAVVNDPLRSSQWHIDMINLPAAWDKTMGDSSVVVAVIDTGVDYSHEDLAANMWDDGSGNSGYDFGDDDNDPMDEHGHGTHVAGIVAARGDNGIGVSGVAPGARIMALKVADSSGKMTYLAVAEAISYARNNNADVINLSLGNEIPGLAANPLMADQLSKAYDQGIVCVAAAGNDAIDVRDYPAGLAKVISVGSTNASDNVSTFSNYGSWVDIAAPGSTINSTIITNPGVDYAYDSGTSMASPVVAGVCALMLSYYPNLSPESVRYALKSTAVDINSGKDIGAGRVDALAALNYLDSITTSNIGASNLIEKVYCAPNPFNLNKLDEVMIRTVFSTDVDEVYLDIYSISGEKVYSYAHNAPLIDKVFAHNWNGMSRYGNELPTGVYYLLVKAKRHSEGVEDVAKSKMVIIN